MRTRILTIAFVILFGSASSMLVFSRAEAANISFRTSSTVVHQGQDIAIDVLIDPEGQNVNTAAATVTIPADLDFVGVDDSASVIGLWVEEPAFQKETRTITMSGIVPGGFSGLIDPYNPSGSKAGVLIRIILRGRKAGSGLFSLPEVEAYINDGFGTKVPVSGDTLPLVVDELLSPGSLDFFPDLEPPLDFTPVVERDVLLYNNKRVLIFNTKDKGSGMDHYEVKEGSSAWVIVTSPYLLKDQAMKGDILVKAVDRDGNERIKAIPAANPLNQWQVLGLVIVFVLLVVLTLMRMSSHVHKTIQKRAKSLEAAVVAKIGHTFGHSEPEKENHDTMGHPDKTGK